MKITDEIIEQINELYIKCGVKAQVAREIGCSAATVSKYIIPNYVSKSQRNTQEFCGEVGNADYLISQLIKGSATKILCEKSILNEQEKEDLIELQKEIFI